MFRVDYWLVFIFSYWPVIDGISIGYVITLNDHFITLIGYVITLNDQIRIEWYSFPISVVNSSSFLQIVNSTVILSVSTCAYSIESYCSLTQIEDILASYQTILLSVDSID